MPPCNAPNRGRLFPEQANTDAAFARQAGRCGELQMCSLGVWKYAWVPLTVHITQLGKARNHEASGCKGADNASEPRGASRFDWPSPDDDIQKVRLESK